MRPSTISQLLCSATLASTALLGPAHAQTCETKLLAFDGDANEDLGTATAIVGPLLLAGAPGEQNAAGDASAGALYTWIQSPVTSEWFSTGKIQPTTLDREDFFGSSIDTDGTTIVVGAPGKVGVTSTTPGSVHVYEAPGGGFSLQHIVELSPLQASIGDNVGADVAISGDWMVVGAPGDDTAGTNRGAAYLFRRVAGIWIFNRKITPPAGITSGQGFGESVTISDRHLCIAGSTLTAGVTTSGVVVEYFRNSSDVYEEVQLLVPGDAAVADGFGLDMDLENGLLVVGAPNEDDAGNNAGAAYVFRYDSQNRRFEEEAKLVPFGAATNDSVGESVALQGSRVALGAKDRQGGGAAWTFTVASGVWSEERLVRPAELVGYGRGGSHVDLLGDTLVFTDPFDDTRAFSSGAVYALDVAGVDADGNGVTDACEGLFTRYCTNAVPNSTGSAAHVDASGSVFVDDQYLRLTASDLPQDSFGYFLSSTTQGFVTNPGGSQGNLCLGGTIGRFIAQVASSGSDGIIEILVDMDALPSPLPAEILAGETWNYQIWYRDANPTPVSNFSDAVSITFR